MKHTRRRDGLFVTWQRAKGGVILVKYIRNSYCTAVVDESEE